MSLTSVHSFPSVLVCKLVCIPALNLASKLELVPRCSCTILHSVNLNPRVGFINPMKVIMNILYIWSKIRPKATSIRHSAWWQSGRTCDLPGSNLTESTLVAGRVSAVLPGMWSPRWRPGRRQPCGGAHVGRPLEGMKDVASGTADPASPEHTLPLDFH